MTEPCQEFDRRLQLPSSEWAEHRRRCASCRAQWAVDVELRQLFDGVPAATLSAGFDGALRERLDAAATRASPARLRRFLMPIYWCGAVAVTPFILAGLEWPETSAAGLGLGSLALALVTLCGPILFLTRQFRIGVFELIFLSTAARPTEQIFQPTLD